MNSTHITKISDRKNSCSFVARDYSSLALNTKESFSWQLFGKGYGDKPSTNEQQPTGTAGKQARI